MTRSGRVVKVGTSLNPSKKQRELVAQLPKLDVPRAEDAPPSWDTSPGRKWVVVAFWGVETTVTFHRDQQEASNAWGDALDAGADAFYAETKRMMMQSDKRL